MSVRDLHQDAMHWAGEGLRARLKGDAERAREYFIKALESEREAAEQVPAKPPIEPTRSVLFRSAASLAMDCGLYREAERLAATGLAGEPPDDIADELRDVIDRATFERHLVVRGVSLAAEDVQLTINGRAVREGLALASEFISRVQTYTTMLYRTAARQLKEPYDDAAAFAKQQAERFAVYLSVPREASFAVSIRVGQQLELPNILAVSISDVIDETLTGLELFNRGATEELKERIPETAYYNNFVGLAKRIAPDGDRIGLVGFTSMRSGRERRVALRASTQAPAPMPVPVAPLKKVVELVEYELTPFTDTVSVIGQLKLADDRGRHGKIQLVDDDNQRHVVMVPDGMMSDIVKPLWDEKVTVTGKVDNRGVIYLEEISPAK